LGTAALLGSVTTPRRDVVACAHAERVEKRNAALRTVRNKTWKIFFTVCLR
jgi:hypothetical protein